MEKSFKIEREIGDESLHENWKELLRKAALAGCEKGLADPIKKDDEYESLIIHKKLPESVRGCSPELVSKIETNGGTILEILDDVNANRGHFKYIGGHFVPIENLIFQNKDGISFEIADLLSDNVYFVRGDHFSCDSFAEVGLDKKVEKYHIVEYSPEDLRKSGGITDLLHEIGHSKGSERVSIELLKKHGNIMHGLQYPDQSKFIKEFSADERALVLQIERNAWAWAIKTLRILREKGIDLIPGWGKKEIRNWVDGYRLKRYEQSLHVSKDFLRQIRKRRLKE